MKLPQALSTLFSSISSDDTSAVNDSNDNNIKYDVLLENQRGVKLFGIPLYGSDPILTPFDPPKFETLSGLKVPNMYHYPLPGKSWVWCWKSWHILMIKDVDEEGWIYARMRFGSHHWKGVGKFGNFVRRRIWIRKRERFFPENGLPSEKFEPEILVVNKNDGTLSKKELKKEQKQERKEEKKERKREKKKQKTNKSTSSKSATAKPVIPIIGIEPVPDQEKISSSAVSQSSSESEVESCSDFDSDLESQRAFVETERRIIMNAFSGKHNESYNSEDRVFTKVNKLINDLANQPIDRLRTHKLIQFFEDCSNADLQTIIGEFESQYDDYSNNLNHPDPVFPYSSSLKGINSDFQFNDSWLSEMLESFQFNDSRRKFIAQFELIIDKRVSFDHEVNEKREELLTNILKKYELLLNGKPKQI
ncbi:unnamed protein product [Ambrosiozyma monospora]|uniref:Unnamed protein product n=1 Tax=Ambrosiozyma monospora TaxID=43982 RepID=A0A9W7DMB1_AMBMO|nr:unnamed protein product [Ambrosiozyma monospora]